MKTIGFDFGSVYTKGILVENGTITNLSFYRRKDAGDLSAISDFLTKIDGQFPGEKFGLGITGVAKSDLNQEKFVVANAIIATATGARTLGFSGQSIIEIGAQNAKLIILDPENAGNIREFTMNDACAAGCGMFIEQQAKRLQLSLEEFARLSTAVENHVTIAGRCAVFAKSDMIHLQQKGSHVDELAYGLCTAICRNFQAMLLKGRELEPPVMIAGGCAKNGGIIRAFNEILGIHSSEKLFVSPQPGLEGAIGAAIKAEKDSPQYFSIQTILQNLSEIVGATEKEPDMLPPLVAKPVNNDIQEPEGILTSLAEGYLGVDIGSVSTDLAVITPEGEVISSVYLPTRGRPIDVLREGLAILKERFAGGLKILGCGTTGSGRHLAGKILGSDIVKNEITCQFLGVQHYLKDVDTIFEIGGQDSKYISVRNASISDFVMNKVCAAGTGSFLEEQAREMGISIINEFSSCAFAAKNPVDLGSHCTVFMETEVVGAMQRGISTADICAGLAYSIVRNYLEKVVGNKPIGKHIAFQGGVASNAAVVAAFAQTLQQPVDVIPYNRISGAIGAAIAAKNHMSGQQSTFRGLDCSVNAILTTFHCHQCSNNCEVSLIKQGGEKIYYGDTCERYTSGSGTAAAECRIPNLAADYLTACESYFSPGRKGALQIGIPRASTIMGYLPFWGTFFRELGCTAVLSATTSSSTLALGLKNLPASVCLPAKLTAGHVTELHAMNLDYVFIPSVMHLPGNDPEHSYACPYAMAMPYMINKGFTTKVLSPVISMVDVNTFTDGFSGFLTSLNTTSAKIKKAYHTALQEQKTFHEKMQNRVAELIAGGEYSYIFSIIGKPYNVFDSYLNLSLFERLRRLGVLAIPLAILPLKTTDIQCMLPWELSVKIFQGAVASAKTDNIFPLVISNYGCALDAFTFRQLEAPLLHKPHLIVEFDEHRGEVGLITRLEAFMDQLASVKKLRIEIKDQSMQLASAALVPDTSSKICMPYWSDYVYAYAGIWEYKGYQVEILPIPDQNIRILGEKYSLGKECSPYAMVVGDLVQLHQKNPDRQLVYHFPSVTFPCLLCQYGNSMQILIRELGITNIRLSCLNGTELTLAFGVRTMQKLYEGLLAVDVLVKAACETRPYEKEPGMTGALHHQNLMRVKAGIASGNVIPALDESLRAIATIPVNRSKRRPIVGVAGDLYTKVNESANNNLFMGLEAQGLEVWPSSQVDLLDCGITSSFLRSIEKVELGGIVTTGTVALMAMIGAWRIRRAVRNRVEHLSEPGYREMLKLAEPYMNNTSHELLLVNIAKIVDFVERGADGVINATCFNCMIGNASAAIIEKIRHDHHGTPIITAVYSGSENPGRQMQLDAFTCQVKEHFKTTTL